MRTFPGPDGDRDQGDFQLVIQRVLSLHSVELSLIPDGILLLCSDRDRHNILVVMQAIGGWPSRP